MNNLFKKFSLFLIIVFSLVILPINVRALSGFVNYKNINEKTNLTVGNLKFDSISFHDYSNTSALAFGLSGNVFNESDKAITFRATANYYDQNKNLVATTNRVQTVLSGANNVYNHMANLNQIKAGHNVSNIAFYTLNVEIIDSSVSIIKPSQDSVYKSLPYVIDSYDINIKVNEDNTFDIKETITAYFNQARHGIYRIIPLKNEGARLDGTTFKNRAKISNLSLNHEYSKSYEDDNYKLQIGSEDRTITGEEKYVISYTYDLGKDKAKDYDELYFNIIGNSWDTVIGNITFTIDMPKDFDASKLGFSAGHYGSTSSDKIDYSVAGTTIKGRYDGILGSKQAITVRAELPEGYFVNAGLKLGIFEYLMFILPFLFLEISIFLWYKYGKDDHVIETVEFYPPEGFNSLDVGYYYKGLVNDNDVISLLIYLANKGYLKIEEIKTGKKSSFKLTKLKDYDGNDVNERMFLNGLFRNSSTINLKDLEYRFYKTINSIFTNVQSDKSKMFEKSASSKIKYVVLMVIVIFLLITVKPVMDYSGIEEAMVSLVFTGIGFSLMFSMFVLKNQTIYVNGKATNSSIAVKLFGLLFGLIFGGGPLVAMVLPALQIEPIYLFAYIFGLVCVFGMIICISNLPKRTSYGNEMLGKIKGFKTFLTTAEKEKLELMVMDNPTYFYDILPYAYVLGVSKKWIEKFESIAVTPPTWYYGYGTFNITTFGDSITSTMNTASSVMTSSYDTSSSGSSGSFGGSSGGGFSGGGSGGGGGGSW